ncbi:FecR family protein [Caulobacter sp. CCH5-E12]|uniref:FecR family protein n=1 Tax=Caulobacter sp. CCH5-E12 TaxID=1768770 RepID=UPI000A566AB5|nr:FecR family protein [Caulobacter sp. CCH5-E12]
MIKDRGKNGRITREAAAWHALLNDTHPRIETEDLEAFSAWQSDPSNKAAYDRIDDISRGLRALQDDPDIRQATAEALARGPERRRFVMRLGTQRVRVVVGSLVAASVVASVAGGYIALRPTYATEVGQTFSARLSDGSRLTLDTDSQVRVRFSGGERRIELLRGQAIFEVAHNAQRPFIVQAGDTRVRATGTRFEVRRIGQDVRVTLTQGSVEVVDRDAKAKTWRLRPGETLALKPAGASIATPTSVDIQTATSWTTGTVTFQDVPLDEAVAELNRYSRDKIVLGDGAPRTRRVSGVFSTGDNDDFIAALSAYYGLQSDRKSNGDIELQPKGGPKT